MLLYKRLNSLIGGGFKLQYFSSRAPDSAPLKSKMIYASSKDAIKRKFEGEYLGGINVSIQNLLKG